MEPVTGLVHKSSKNASRSCRGFNKLQGSIATKWLHGIKRERSVQCRKLVATISRYNIYDRSAQGVSFGLFGADFSDGELWPISADYINWSQKRGPIILVPPRLHAIWSVPGRLEDPDLRDATSGGGSEKARLWRRTVNASTKSLLSWISCLVKLIFSRAPALLRGASVAEESFISEATQPGISRRGLAISYS